MKTREEIMDLITKTEKDIRNLDIICKYSLVTLNGETFGYQSKIVYLNKEDWNIIYNALKEKYLETLKTLTKELDEHLNKKEES